MNETERCRPVERLDRRCGPPTPPQITDRRELGLPAGLTPFGSAIATRLDVIECQLFWFAFNVFYTNFGSQLNLILSHEMIELSTNMMQVRKINFGAGPAKIPEEVLLKACDETISFRGTGIGILEISHRSKEFAELLQETKQLLRELMSVPDEFEILFMQGGGTGQFAAVPMNLKSDHEFADYMVTGAWSNKAAEEGSKYIRVKKVFTPSKPYVTIPDESQWDHDKGLKIVAGQTSGTDTIQCANSNAYCYNMTASAAALIDIVKAGCSLWRCMVSSKKSVAGIWSQVDENPNMLNKRSGQEKRLLVNFTPQTWMMILQALLHEATEVMKSKELQIPSMNFTQIPLNLIKSTWLTIFRVLFHGAIQTTKSNKTQIP
uniref:Aminotran_5 domain-containing protein n=1 Tax=Angiostrongylus cantonensis TaxID=6313 RepID=A0A158P9H6_ANGCA